MYKNKTSFILSFCFLLMLFSCGKMTEETSPIRKDVTETVFASGYLEAKNTYSLTAQADGYLSLVNFEEGDLVKKGTVLAMVDNQESQFNESSAKDLYDIAQSNTKANAPALAQAQNSIQISKQKMEQDFHNLQRYTKLLESNTVAKIDFENVALQYKTSKANYETALENLKLLKQQADQSVITNRAQKSINQVIVSKNQVKALGSGKIYKKYKNQGDFVKRGETIALIGDPNVIYAEVSIDEGNINKIKVGQEALVQLNTQRDKSYKAKVAEIYPTFDEGTQSFTCKLIFLDSLDFSIINTQLQSNIIVGTSKNALLIPRNYIDFGGYVQIKDKKNKVKVVTKFVSNEWVQVLEGIDDHTILVTENISENNLTTSEVDAQLHK